MDTSRSPAESSGFSRKLAAAIIIIYTVVTLIPITWIVLTGFKSVDSAITYPPEVFFEPSLEGYVNLFTTRTRQSKEYLEADKRSIANSIQIFFKDGSSTEKIEVEYPIGHRRRREQGIPLLLEKFERAHACVAAIARRRALGLSRPPDRALPMTHGTRRPVAQRPSAAAALTS